MVDCELVFAVENISSKREGGREMNEYIFDDKNIEFFVNKYIFLISSRSSSPALFVFPSYA